MLWVLIRIASENWQLSRPMTKPTKWLCAQRKLWSDWADLRSAWAICPVWSDFSLCAQWVAKDPSFLHVDSKDSDQTGRMPRLIWFFAGCTCQFVGFVMRRLKYPPYLFFWVSLGSVLVIIWYVLVPLIWLHNCTNTVHIITNTLHRETMTKS